MSNRQIAKKSIIIIIISALVISTVMMTSAYFDSSQTVTINADEIEVSTLVVGTHLIHISAMTEELYEIASESASNSGQSGIYYKSEFADGQWFDVDSATGLDDITSNGTAVDESVIEALLFTHHTKSDGKTYDLVSGNAVAVVDINDLYNLEELTELDSLITEYTMLSVADELEDMDQNNLNSIKEFLTQDLSNDETNAIDAKINSVNTYMNGVDDSTDRSTLQEVMSQLDASRRAEVYEQLSTSLDTLSLTIESNSKDDMDGASSIFTAIATCIQEVEDSLITYQGESLTEGSDVLSQKLYEATNNLVVAIQTGNDEDCESLIEQIQVLNNLLNGTSTSPSAELVELLDLIEEQKVLIQTTIKEGTDEDDVDTLKSQLSELEYYVEQACDRMSKDEELEYLVSLAKEIISWKEIDPYTDVEEDVIKCLDDCNANINSLYATALAESSNTEQDALLAQKEALQTEMMSKLDDEQLEDVKALELQIEEIDKQIDDLNNAILEEIEELQQRKTELEAKESTTSIESEIADIDLQLIALNAQIASGSVAESINTYKTSALEKISSEGTAEEVLSDVLGIEALIISSGETAGVALQEIYQAAAEEVFLNDQTQFEEILDYIEEVVGENASLLSSSTTAEEIEAIINAVLEIDLFSEKSADVSLSEYEHKLVLAIIGLSEYLKIDTTNLEGQSVLTELVNRAVNEDNPEIFEIVSYRSYTLVPVDMIAETTGYRYIWNSSYRQAILALRQSYYTFQAFDAEVQLNGNETDEMDVEAQFKNSTLYIESGYAESEFDFFMKTVYGTDYGIVYEEQDLDTINTLLDELGGGS